MTSATMSPAGSRTAPPGTYRASRGGTLRSELTKIRSVRSTYWTLAVLVLAGLAWAVADCAGTAAHWAQTPAVVRAGFDPTQASIVGVALLGQLVIAVLGTLVITSEYSTGMIRTSLTVMPRRPVLFGAKAVTFAGISLVLGFGASFASFFLGQRLLASTHQGATLDQPEVLRAVVAGALFVALCGLFAFGLGAILRSTAGGITAAFGLLFLVPQLAKALPSDWYADVVRWLPGGDVVPVITSTVGLNNPPHMFSAWGELAVFAGYAVILLAVGAVAFSRRDA
jgi:ABC-2 type transport system permease protein